MTDGGQWEGPMEVRGRDGIWVAAYVRNKLLSDADGWPTGVIGVSVDTTERVLMACQLRGARDFLATVTHTMPDGLFVLDVEGRVTLVNEAAERMLGWTERELLGELMHEKTHALTADGASEPADSRSSRDAARTSSRGSTTTSSNAATARCCP